MNMQRLVTSNTSIVSNGEQYEKDSHKKNKKRSVEIGSEGNISAASNKCQRTEKRSSVSVGSKVLSETVCSKIGEQDGCLIFREVTNIEDLKNLRLVCKHFWKLLNLNFFVSHKYFSSDKKHKVSIYYVLSNAEYGNLVKQIKAITNSSGNLPFQFPILIECAKEYHLFHGSKQVLGLTGCAKQLIKGRKIIQRIEFGCVENIYKEFFEKCFIASNFGSAVRTVVFNENQNLFYDAMIKTSKKGNPLKNVQVIIINGLKTPFILPPGLEEKKKAYAECFQSLQKIILRNMQFPDEKRVEEDKLRKDSLNNLFEFISILGTSELQIECCIAVQRFIDDVVKYLSSRMPTLKNIYYQSDEGNLLTVYTREDAVMNPPLNSTSNQSMNEVTIKVDIDGQIISHSRERNESGHFALNEMPALEQITPPSNKGEYNDGELIIDEEE